MALTAGRLQSLRRRHPQRILSYKGAPKVGSAWLNSKVEKRKARLLRSGFWCLNARFCSSA